MPDVLPYKRKGRARKVIGVDDKLYGIFLRDCLEHPDICGFLNTLSRKNKDDLSKYIVNRLAEVDPGYVAPDSAK